MSAIVVLKCQPKSHPFQDRHLTLNDPAKVGRAVARVKPSNNNAIFDCKVLSRNHAVIKYINDKFYLQDTQSSNGTFVNNQRLSKGSEESEPHEIFSGDTVQFGVEVMENSRNVTHGCIIAQILLYYPDGTEATPNFHNGTMTMNSSSIQSQDLYVLANYLKEALHREKLLENKLLMLQKLLQSTQEISEAGWQALIDEDRLLSRLEVLENQLQVYSKNQTEDTLRAELVALHEDKYHYETKSKDSLRKVLQEKLDAIRKLTELERTLANTEDECNHLKDLCENSEKELQELNMQHQEQLTIVASLRQDSELAESKYEEKLAQAEVEKSKLLVEIEVMYSKENVLSAKIESLQADNDFVKEQLQNMKARMESYKEKSSNQIDDTADDDEKKSIEITDNGVNSISQAVQVDLINMLDLQLLQDNDEELSKSDDSDTLNDKIQEYEIQLHDSKEKIENLQKQLKNSEQQLNQVTENTMIDLQDKLTETVQQNDEYSQFINQLQNEITRLQNEIQNIRKNDENTTIIEDNYEEDLNSNGNSMDYNDTTLCHHGDNSISTYFEKEVEKYKGLLEEKESLCQKYEKETENYKDELNKAQQLMERSTEESIDLESQLKESKIYVEDQEKTVSDLKDQLNQVIKTNTDVGKQVSMLQEKLQEEQDLSILQTRELNKLGSECKIWRLPASVQLVWHG